MRFTAPVFARGRRECHLTQFSLDKLAFHPGAPGCWGGGREDGPGGGGGGAEVWVRLPALVSELGGVNARCSLPLVLVGSPLWKVTPVLVPADSPRVCKPFVKILEHTEIEKAI